MRKVVTFRNLIRKEAVKKFAITVLYEMVKSNDSVKIDAIFEEGKVGQILSKKKLEDLSKKAKEILPVKVCYEESEKEDMQKFIDYRDELLKACGSS